MTDSQKLRDMYIRLQDRDQLSAGDLVIWKDGLKNRRLPNYGQRGIVIEVLDEPVYDANNESGSTYFREPLDVVIGFFDEDNDFMTFHYDSRRFMKVDGAE